MFRQQFAAVVTAVRCVPVAKKSRNWRQAVRPPSRTIDAGKSIETLDNVCSLVSNAGNDQLRALTLKACSATSIY